MVSIQNGTIYTFMTKKIGQAPLFEIAGRGNIFEYIGNPIKYNSQWKRYTLLYGHEPLDN